MIALQNKEQQKAMKMTDSNDQSELIGSQNMVAV